MTNPPTAADLIGRAVPCIEYLVSQGCPGLPEWLFLANNYNGINLDDGCLKGDHAQACSYIRNPTAVLDSIVVWVNGTAIPYLRSDLAYTRGRLVAKVGDDLNGVFKWSMAVLGERGDRQGYSPTYPEATIAMLEAITEEVKGGEG